MTDQGNIIDPIIGAMLAEMAEQNAPSLSSLPVDMAREVVREMTQVEEPTDIDHIEMISITGPAGTMPARLYRPIADETLPALVFYHGGGWVICDLDTHDEVCRRLADEARCLVVSVDYRMAPEHVFPACVDDACAALDWVRDNAADLNIDPDRIAVGGDSAGGNLAAVTALRAKANNGPSIAFQLLIYPVTNLSDMSTQSYLDFAEGFQLARADMQWFRDTYMGEDGDPAHADVSPLLAQDLSGLPKAYVATAGFDILRDEGHAYADALKAAGVEVEQECFTDQIHGFMNLAAAIPSSSAACSSIAKKLHEAFKL